MRKFLKMIGEYEHRSTVLFDRMDFISILLKIC